MLFFFLIAVLKSVKCGQKNSNIWNVKHNPLNSVFLNMFIWVMSSFDNKKFIWSTSLQ